jgi:hypothetical protein
MASGEEPETAKDADDARKQQPPQSPPPQPASSSSRGVCRVHEYYVSLDGYWQFDFVEGDSLAPVFGKRARLLTHSGFPVLGDVSIPRSLHPGRVLRVQTSSSGPRRNFLILGPGEPSSSSSSFSTSPSPSSPAYGSPSSSSAPRPALRPDVKAPRMCGICRLPWGHKPSECWYWDVDSDGEYCEDCDDCLLVTDSELHRRCRWCAENLKPTDLHWECEECSAHTSEFVRGGEGWHWA